MLWVHQALWMLGYHQEGFGSFLLDFTLWLAVSVVWIVLLCDTYSLALAYIRQVGPSLKFHLDRGIMSRSVDSIVWNLVIPAQYDAGRISFCRFPHSL